MSGWLAIIALALVAFLAGTWLLRAHRGLWTVLGTVLVLGLAGYAWQGSPSYPASSAAASEDQNRGSPGLIDARREFFDPANPPSRFVITADAFARQGDYERAAEILNGVVAENPQDGEAWLALGVAITEHAGGRVPPAAEAAFREARARLPGNPGPAFFEGVNSMRGGNFPRTRDLWAEGLSDSEEDAPGFAYVAERLLGLDRLMASIAEQHGGGMPGEMPLAPPSAPPPSMPPSAPSAAPQGE